MSSSQPRRQDQQRPEEEEQEQEQEMRGSHHVVYEEPPEEDDPNIVLNDFDDYRRMLLFDFERDCAEYIKEQVEADPELDNLSDYQYALLALMELERDETTEYTLERVRNLQEFKKEYKIQDTYEEGRRYLRQLVELWPSHFLNVALNPENGVFTVVIDLKGVDGSLLKNSVRNVNTWMCGTFYQFHAYAPDFRAQRQGVTCVVELQGFDWNKHLSYKMVRKFHDELGRAYPVKFQKTTPHNVGFWGNLILSVFRKFSPEKLGENFRLVNHRSNSSRNSRNVTAVFSSEDNTSLDALFLQPTPEDAKERVIQQFDECLKKRYENEKEFSL